MAAKGKGKAPLAKLAKTKPAKGMKKAKAPAAPVMQQAMGGMMQPAPGSLGEAFGP